MSAKSTKIDNVSIPVFNSGNFISWKFRLKHILKYKECLQQMLGGIPQNIEQVLWK